MHHNLPLQHKQIERPYAIDLQSERISQQQQEEKEETLFYIDNFEAMGQEKAHAAEETTSTRQA